MKLVACFMPELRMHSYYTYINCMFIHLQFSKLPNVHELITPINCLHLRCQKVNADISVTHPTHCLCRLSYYYEDFHFLVCNIFQSGSKVPISEKFMAASLFCSEGEGCMYPTILVPLHQTTKGHMPDHQQSLDSPS